MMAVSSDRTAVTQVNARAYTVPTDHPESDGTLEWDSTTLVLATVQAGDETGIGWTYGHQAIASVIQTALATALVGRDAFDVPVRGRPWSPPCATTAGPGSARWHCRG